MEWRGSGRGLWNFGACQSPVTPGNASGEKRRKILWSPSFAGGEREPVLSESSCGGRLVKTESPSTPMDVNNNLEKTKSSTARRLSLGSCGGFGDPSKFMEPISDKAKPKAKVPSTSPVAIPQRHKPSTGGDGSPSSCFFCSRPEQTICCKSCGHTFRGRVRIKCENHPCFIHLMDFEACINCKAYQLMEFQDRESHTPPGEPPMEDATECWE